MTWEAELAFAHHLADLADAISLPYFARDAMSVRTKADGTPVTEADERIEEVLRGEISSAYPNHGVVGEEGGDTAGSSDARWIVDPIDATLNFSWGIRIWGTLIALERDGSVVVGVASAPALGERYSAARGLGSHLNGTPIQVSDVADLADARVGFTSVAGFEEAGLAGPFLRLVGAAAHDRGIGDFYGHMLVASGHLDAMVEPVLAPWDLGPLGVIVEEAGGRLTDITGAGGIYGGSGVTSNGLVHEAVLAYFRHRE